MTIPTPEQIQAEIKRRECVKNPYTGVAPVLMRINGKYQKVIPKLQQLFTIAGICDDMPDQTRDFDFFPLEGGRAGGKSESLAHLLIEISEVDENAVCICTREVQNSINESVYSYLKKWSKILGYDDHFKFIQSEIINEKTGFKFIFKGMTSGTRNDAIKSVDEAKYVWCEEAQSLSHDSIKMLLPTVRTEGRKLFFTYNRKTEKDPVVKIKKRRKAFPIIINYFDNPFLKSVSWDEAQEDKMDDLEEYLHVWEGHPMKDDPRRVVIPYSWLVKCLNIHKDKGIEPTGRHYAGVDVAEGETVKHDKNSIAVRHSFVMKHHDSWQCKNIYESVGVVRGKFYEWGFEDLYYDGIGVGSAFGSECARIDSTEESKLPFNYIPFKGSGTGSGSSVYGADTIYTRHGSKIIYNKDFFKNTKSQQWWNIRLMVQNSVKMRDGKDIDRSDYFLSFEGTEEEWRDVFYELSQATYKEDGAGKKIIDKIPGVHEYKDPEGNRQIMKSPNAGDAVGYSLAKYFENGLRAHGTEIVKEKEEEFIMPTMTL